VCLTGLIFDLIPFTQKIDKDKSTVKNAWVYNVSRVYILLFDLPSNMAKLHVGEKNN